MLAVLYAISVAWRAVVYWGVPQGSAVAFLGNFWLPAQLDVFALGMGLAVVRVVGRRAATDRCRCSR